MKRILKHIAVAMLALNIALTGISLDGTMTTANAAATVDSFKTGGTVTMKPGDAKKLLVVNADGEDITNKYKWSSSNENVATVSVEFVDETVDYTECIEITAVASGKATITAEYKGTTIHYDMNVNVTLPKMTAAQKKCKHTWKVTKKATCAHGGVKTCTRCKLQKETKKTAHKYVDHTIVTEVWDSFYYIEFCTKCALDPTVKKGEVFTVRVKLLGSLNDAHNELAPDSEYTVEEQRKLMGEHLLTHGFTQLSGGEPGSVGIYATASYNQSFEPCDTHDEKTTVKECFYCNARK